MDAPHPSTVPTIASRTPLHLGAVGLVVRDLDLVAGYYRHLLGIGELARDGDTMRLGIDGVTLIELTRRRDARPDDPREAGLYHTAFLMPTRADLGRWVRHIGGARVPVSGAAS